MECELCGGLVNLDSLITVKLVEADGSEAQAQMTEREARDLLAEVGLPCPPVMCDQHERIEITTEALV